MARWLILFASLLAAPLVSGFAAAADPAPEDLIKAGHWKRARALLGQRYPGSHNLPSDARDAYLLSRVKMAFGDLDGALELAEKAVAVEGANASYHFQLGVVCGETADRASLFSKAGWARRFMDETEKAAALDPKNVEARFALIEYYLQAPRLMGGSKEKARALADEIGKVDPAQGFLGQARLAEEAKDAANEEALYLKALAASPHDYEVVEPLAEFYWKLAKNPDLAEKYARQAVQIEPGQARAYAVLAAVYAGGQRWNDLEAILAEAGKNVPDDLNPYYQAGRTLLVEGKDLPRAEGYFRKYLTQEPEADDPSLADAHWRLGLALEKQGRKPEAVSELETALRMKPDLREAKKDLARLK
jgi:tetratricopeptide (TPR) repeat protein